MPNRANQANINITSTEIYAARVYLFIAHSLFNCLIVYCLFILMDALSILQSGHMFNLENPVKAEE